MKYRHLVFAIVFTVLFSTHLLAQGGPQWESTNPGAGGYFTRVAAGPSGIIIACSDLSGAYRSLDRGETWDVIGPARGLNTTHVSGVAFHPTNAALIYLATGNGIFRSVDYGQNFQAVVTSGYAEHLAIAPSNAQVVYAGWHPQYNSNAGQILKTIDGGQTWQQVDIDLPTGRRIIEVRVTPQDENCVYILTGHGRFASGPRDIYRSDDGGVHWVSLGSSFNNLVIDMALDPFDPDGLYASVSDASAFNIGHLYRSDDQGDTWTYLAQQGGFIWPHAQIPGTIRTIQSRYQYPWLSTEGIWESTQYGAAGTWTRLSGVADWDSGWSSTYWSFNSASISGAVSVDLSDPESMFWCGSQFLYGTFDGGQSAEQLFANEIGGAASGRWRSRGLDNVVIVDLAINEANPDEIYAGYFDLGLFVSLDGGESWSPRNEPTTSGNWGASGGNTWTLLTDPGRPGIVWASQAPSKSANAFLFKSSDSGLSWPIQGQGLPAAPLTGLSIDRASPTNNRTLYIAAGGDVYGSTNDGQNWSLLHADGGLRYTAVDRHDSTIVYAGGENGLWRSDQSGSPGTWIEVGLPSMRGAMSGLPTAWMWEGVHDIVSDPGTPGRLLVAIHGSGKGLFRSSDNGTTWEPAPLITNDHLRSVALDPADSNIVYATSSAPLSSGGYSPDSLGVMLSLDGGSTWTPINDGLTWDFANAIALGPAGSDRVFIGSPGTGVHRMKTPTLTSDVSNFSGTTGGTVNFSLNAGAAGANKLYILLGSLSGTSPGINVAPNFVLPINADSTVVSFMEYANSMYFVNSYANFDASGHALVTLHMPPGIAQPYPGEHFSFAFMTLDPVDFVSPPLSILITP